MSTAWVYQELRAIRERAEAGDAEAQIRAVEERLRRAIEARRQLCADAVGMPSSSSNVDAADSESAAYFGA